MIINAADGVVAVQSETVSFISEIYGIPSDKIIFIPLGCDIYSFHRDEQLRNELRHKYGINNDDVVFCYAGKLIEDKGVKILIKAALELLKYKKNIKILCIGGRDVKYFKDIENQISKSNQHNKFIFINAVPNKDLYMYYSMADVGVWPKQCSLTMLEAMACSLPIIISRTSGVSERVIDGKNGFLYTEWDIIDLKDKMEIFLDKTLLKTMSVNARSFVEIYDWKNISNSFEHIYMGNKNTIYKYEAS